MEVSKSGGRLRSLGDHVLLQQLQRSHEDLLSFAIANSASECLVLVPQESHLKGFALDQGTPYGDSYMNLKGQEVERRGDEFITSLGFRTKICAAILREERMFGSGGAFCCLLISAPLLPLPPGRQAETGALTSSTRKTETTVEVGPQGIPVSPESPMPALTATETQQRVDRLWKQGAQAALAERRVHAEIMRFKGTHVLVPGFDAALAQRMGRLVAACCRHLPPNLAESREVQRLIERFVWLEVHDRLWPFFLETAEAQQAALERGLEIFRADIPSALDGLGLRRELRGVLPVDAAKELEKMSSMLLPHEKLHQLCLAVEAIHRACDLTVTVASSQAPVSFKRKEPVEVCCEDLVALLVLALAECSGGPLVASYLHMSVLMLQQSREARYEREAFYVTALHSALTYASRLQHTKSGKIATAA